MSVDAELKTEKPDLSLSILHWGLLVIVAIMPFHAFLSVYFGSLTGHQQVIQAWKEVLIGVLTVIAIAKLILSPKLRQILLRPTNFIIACFIFISLLTSLVHVSTEQNSFWFGAKTDLEFLIVFVIAQLANRDKLEARLIKIVIITATIVTSIGALLATVLDKNFLTHFGYGPSTILPYQLVDPALPKDIRVLSTLSGPNQLGSFLILPISLMLYMIIKKRYYLLTLPLVVCLFTLLHTFSRSAWIGASLAIALTLILSLPRKAAYVFTSAGIIAFILLLIQSQTLLREHPKLQYIVLHSQSAVGNLPTSNNGHLSSLNRGLTQAVQHPLGLGLGTAGPASFHSSKALITENYYLQLAVETGIIGLILFLAVTVLLMHDLFVLQSVSLLAAPCLAAFIGLAVANLLLHTWADSSTALVFWSVAGATVLDRSKDQKHA